MLYHSNYIIVKLFNLLSFFESRGATVINGWHYDDKKYSSYLMKLFAELFCFFLNRFSITSFIKFQEPAVKKFNVV